MKEREASLQKKLSERISGNACSPLNLFLLGRGGIPTSIPTLNSKKNASSDFKLEVEQNNASVVLPQDDPSEALCGIGYDYSGQEKTKSAIIMAKERVLERSREGNPTSKPATLTSSDGKLIEDSKGDIDRSQPLLDL